MNKWHWLIGMTNENASMASNNSDNQEEIWKEVNQYQQLKPKVVEELSSWGL